MWQSRNVAATVTGHSCGQSVSLKDCRGDELLSKQRSLFFRLAMMVTWRHCNVVQI